MQIETIVTISWVLLIIGIFLAVLSLFFDFDELLDSVGISPLSFGSFVTVLGGSGLILSKMTESLPIVIGVSFLFAFVLTLLVHFYILPMKKTESSLSYGMDSLNGATGKVITAIPADGVGEVLINTGLSVSNRSAKSYDGVEIPEGSNVLVIEIKDNIFYVSKVEE